MTLENRNSKFYELENEATMDSGVCVYACVSKDDEVWRRKTIKGIVLLVQISVRQSYRLSCREFEQGCVLKILVRQSYRLSCRAQLTREATELGKTIYLIVLPSQLIKEKFKNT